MPHKIQRNGSSDPNKWTITSYRGDEKLRFLKSGNKYFQIIEDMDARDYMDPDDPKRKDESLAHYVLAASNDWGSETIKDGYKAQARVKNLIENKKIKDIVIIVDRNAAIGKKIEKTSLYYNSFLFNPNLVGQLINDMFKRDISDFSLATSTFLPFGCDKYG